MKGAPDFLCPHGRPWGYIGGDQLGKSLILPDNVVTICLACPDRKHCINVRGCGGCQEGPTVNIIAPCPVQPPRWEVIKVAD